MVRIHGGGWVGGAPEDDEALNDHICRICEVAIVSPEYRLAPEGGVTFLDEIEDGPPSDGRNAQAASRFGTGPAGDGGDLGRRSSRCHHAVAAPRHAGSSFWLDHRGAPRFGPYDVAGTPSQRLATEETLIVTRMWLEAFREPAFPGRDLE